MPYIGNQPGTGVRNRFIYTATASQTTFTGADNNSKTLKYADSDYIDVYLNGVCLVPGTDYTASTKTSVVLTQAASLNDTLEVVAYDIATISDTVSKADGGTFNGDLLINNSSPDITLTNNTTEDTDGGRESTVTFKGLQSGGEESTLAQIQASHDGTSDDEKGDLIFKTNDGNDSNSPTERWRITSDGHFKAAANGYGIDFSATEGSGAASSILDDYEEGNWTADVSVGTVSNVTQATYTKIGNVVHVQCKLNTFSESSSSASLTITGMPFAAFSADRSAIATSALSKNISGTNDINVYFPTTTSIYLYGSITGGDFDNLKYSDLSSGMILYLGFSYFAA